MHNTFFRMPTPSGTAAAAAAALPCTPPTACIDMLEGIDLALNQQQHELTIDPDDLILLPALNPLASGEWTHLMQSLGNDDAMQHIHPDISHSTSASYPPATATPDSTPQMTGVFLFDSFEWTQSLSTPNDAAIFQPVNSDTLFPMTALDPFDTDNTDQTQSSVYEIDKELFTDADLQECLDMMDNKPSMRR